MCSTKRRSKKPPKRFFVDTLSPPLLVAIAAHKSVKPRRVRIERQFRYRVSALGACPVSLDHGSSSVTALSSFFADETIAALQLSDPARVRLERQFRYSASAL
ncbi:MAG: hypothetical protein AAB727_03090 [Patescibacteria group bacterium]